MSNVWAQPPARLGMVRFIGGQLCMWDDSPDWEFGQVWISVCIWCHRGPLDAGEGLACLDCSPTPARFERDVQLWLALEGADEDWLRRWPPNPLWP